MLSATCRACWNRAAACFVSPACASAEATAPQGARFLLGVRYALGHLPRLLEQVCILAGCPRLAPVPKRQPAGRPAFCPGIRYALGHLPRLIRASDFLASSATIFDLTSAEMSPFR